jgi:hypothetical protein
MGSVEIVVASAGEHNGRGGDDGDATGGEWIKYQINYRLVG